MTSAPRGAEGGSGKADKVREVAQEKEKWAELAALANAAHSAQFSVSCATSYPVTQYAYPISLFLNVLP